MWHSINSCLPDIDRSDSYFGYDQWIKRSRDVLLCMKNKRRLVGYLQVYNEGDGEFSKSWELAGRDGYRVDDVTHWQELPDPPN